MADNETTCMHDGCGEEATQFEEDLKFWHDWIWCDEHATGRKCVPLKEQPK